MGCIDELDYEILLPSSSIKEYADFIKKKIKEIYYVRQGYRIFNTYLIGSKLIPVAVDNDSVILPYVKPCHGNFVLGIKGKADIGRLRAGKSKACY